MQVLRTALDALRIADPRVHRNLTMYPLLAARPTEREYLTLQEALAAKTLRIGEVDGGRVPEVLVMNEGRTPVLLMDGELLKGARQDRVLNLAVLVPAHGQIVVPVSCVEQGRWGGKADFEGTSELLHARARRRKMADVTSSLGAAGVARADQGAIWEAVRRKAARLEVAARTGALDDVYRHHDVELRGFQEHLVPVEGQVGAAFARDGRIVGCELFDHPRTLDVLLPKLVRSYALDAVEKHGEVLDHRGAVHVSDVLRAAIEGRWMPYPAVGQGTEIRLTEPHLEGAGLIEWGRVVQLTLMPRRVAGV